VINKITLINFQSHKKTVLRLCRGINGIIGRSNSGKSAIIRGVELVRNNRPLGFAYHQKNSKDKYTKVFIQNEKEDIRFIKSKSKAEYLLYRKETFEGFKTGVPDRIDGALNLDDINFSSQLGLPFLITSSPAEIARTINQVTKAEDIEKCISISKTKVGKYKSQKKKISSEISDIYIKLKRFKPMQRLKAFIKSAEAYEKKIQKTESQINEVKTIIEFIKTAENAIIAEDQILVPAKLISKAELLQTEIDKTYASIALIEQALNMRESIKIAKTEKNDLIKQYTTELKKQKRCPTCYSKITNNQLQDIRDELK
jgi:exonuclease SbcC